MDYIEGKTLKDLRFKAGRRWGIYDQTNDSKQVYHELARFFVELHQLEFSTIGALGFSHSGIEVCQRPVSVEMAMQEMEGMEPDSVIKPRTTYTTASSYVEDLLAIADNQFNKARDFGLDRIGGKKLLCARYDFQDLVRKKWARPTEHERFVLTHGDMTLHQGNVLFNDDLKLVGVLDWEWSCVVPEWLVVPPVWLTGSGVEAMAFWPDWFNQEVGALLDGISACEKAQQVSKHLSESWKASSDIGRRTSMIVALLNPDWIYEFYWEILGGSSSSNPSDTAQLAYDRTVLEQMRLKQKQFFREEQDFFQRATVRQIMNED